MKLKINDKSTKDLVLNENSRDQLKIQNRNVSSLEGHEVNGHFYNSLHMEPQVKRNMELSKNHPFSKDNINEDIYRQAVALKNERLHHHQLVANPSDPSHLPIIRSSSQTLLPSPEKTPNMRYEIPDYQRDHVSGVLKIMRKEPVVEDPYKTSKVEKEVQQNVSLRKLKQLDRRERLLIGKYKKREASNNIYDSLKTIQQNSKIAL